LNNYFTKTLLLILVPILFFFSAGYTNCVYQKENTSDDIMIVEFEEALRVGSVLLEKTSVPPSSC